MGLFKTNKGIYTSVKTSIFNVKYIRKGEVVECEFQGKIDDMVYDFKAAFPSNEKLDLDNGGTYGFACTLLVSNGKMILFVNKIKDKDAYTKFLDIDNPEEKKDFADFFPSDEKSLLVNMKEEEILTQEPATEETPSVEEEVAEETIDEPDSNTTVNEIPDSDPVDCEKDVLDF